MLKRIFNSFAALILLSVLGLAVLFGIMFMRAARTQEMAAVQDKAYLVASLLERGEFENFVSFVAGNTRMTIIAPDGWLVFDSHENANFTINRADRVEFVQAIAYGSGEAVRASATFGVDTYYYAVLLNDGNVLRLSRTFYSLGEVFLTILPDLMVITFVILVLAYFVAHRLTRNIIKPLATVDLEAPTSGEFYSELEPFMQKIDLQRQEITDQFANLKHAENQRREFTANVSHELKTPLTTISALAEMIASGMAKAEDVPDFASKISSRAKRLVALIEDIIRLSEFDESKVERSFATFDIYDLAQQVIAALQETAAAKQVTMELTGKPFGVRGNSRLLHELLYNLAENAIKYNNDGGHVTIDLRQENGKCKLSVSDTGIGIAAEHQGRVFERFYRADASRSQAISGTGLGLSIVKHIAEHHGGKVELASKEGKGTTFVCYIP